jgi:2-amino-4-hydroxy-6-hydroxymethyldihydropteridine diphosphokinase
LPTAALSTAYVGIGSNLDDPRARVEAALRELATLPATQVLAHSSLYRTPPMGPADQPDYINAVAALATGLAPLALLDALQGLEHRHGRVRTQRWGARTLDLDILLFDTLIIDEPRLTLPHPGLTQRAFVVVPLAEIALDLEIPGIGPLTRVLQALAAAPIVRL